MSTVSDPTRQDISRHSLVLGFAFSLTPQGLPGRYNDHLAKQLKPIIVQAATQTPNNRPWIGMQWEIFDAIEETWDRTTDDLLQVMPLSHVGAPPLFEDSHIINVETIVKHLKLAYDDLLKQRKKKKEKPSNPSTQAGRVLAGKIAELLISVGYPDNPENSSIFDAAMFDKLKIAQYFNRILHDETFHQRFYDSSGERFLELHDLYRLNVGSVGVENRVLPSRDSKLRRFQKFRVNRFIIEAIFPNEQIVQPGKYLSTRGVLDQVAQVIKHEGGRKFEHAFVFGHPEHSTRCRRQLIESGWAADWGVAPEKVSDVNVGTESTWKWDPLSAQLWCRSKQSWDDYERMGKARLD